MKSLSKFKCSEYRISHYPYVIQNLLMNIKNEN